MAPIKIRFLQTWKTRFDRHLLSLAGLAISILLPLLALSNQAVLSYFNNKLYDEFLADTTRGQLSGRVVIVDIDERSMQIHGQWPWPRYKVASIVETASQAGAAAIGLDIIFAEKDRSSLPPHAAGIRQDERRGDYAAGDADEDNDFRLAAALAKSPAVLGYHFRFTAGTQRLQCRLHPLQVTGGETAVSPRDFWPTAEDAICNLELLSVNATRSGFLNISPDADGILRQASMIIAYQDQFYPSMGLALAMQVQGVDYLSLVREVDDLRLQVGDKIIPLNSEGMMMLNYRGASSAFPYVSAAEVLSGKVAPSFFAGKVVLVGTSAIGLREFRATPFDPLFPGVEVHATIVDNLLTGDFLYRPSSARAMEFLAAVVCGFFYLLAVGRGGARRSLLVLMTVSLLLISSAFMLFSLKGVYLSPILPLLVVTANFSLLNLLKFRREEIQAKQQAEKLVRTQGALIEGMASLTESRHLETGHHIKRTQEYVRILARLLQNEEGYCQQIDNRLIDLLYATAPLHDIGKVGIPDSILLKQGKLTAEEFAVVKEHTTIGKDIIVTISNRTGNDRFLAVAYDLIYTHHEKWNGSGYPRGLKGEEIPLVGRIMAIVDMYDALTNKRVYKEKFSHEKSIEIMMEHGGTSFDPGIFKVFIENNESFLRKTAQFETGS